MPDERPLLVIIATGPQRYREYLFASMCTRYRIHLLNTAEPTWERPYLVGSTVVPSTEADVLLEAARAVAAVEPVAGVLSWDEARILQAAMIAQEFGLPGSSPEAVGRCRDKYQTRTALTEAGVPQPRFELVSGLGEALAAAERIGYPVILKPRAAAASYGVVLVHDADQVAAHFGFARDATVPHAPRFEYAVLVEEYLPDPEISIDAAVYRGRVYPMFLAHKEVGFSPYFEETGHYASAGDPLLADPAVLDVLNRTHAALGYTDGCTHSEFKLTRQGPKTIELNGRLGGDLIPYLGLRASGIDPGLAAGAVACGIEPDVAALRDGVGGVRFFYVDRDETVVDEVSFAANGLPAEIDLLVPLAEPGGVYFPPPKGIVSGRIAFATAVGPSIPACRKALDEAGAALRVRERG